MARKSKEGGAIMNNLKKIELKSKSYRFFCTLVVFLFAVFLDRKSVV